MSHVTPTPLSRSKGQLAGDGSILWRPPAQLVNIKSTHTQLYRKIKEKKH